jgi:UDPglucose 6-dehydrogenase
MTPTRAPRTVSGIAAPRCLPPGGRAPIAGRNAAVEPSAAAMNSLKVVVSLSSEKWVAPRVLELRSTLARMQGSGPRSRPRMRTPGTERADPRPVVGVAGLGYMGLATALGFAHHGNPVVGYDLRSDLRRSLAMGHAEIHEPGLSALLRTEVRRGHFRVVSSWEELVRDAKILFLCLPTPAGAQGPIDLRPLLQGIGELGRALRTEPGHRLIVVKSSVVAGTTETILRPLLERVSGRTRAAVGLATNPEFLAEGTMVGDVLHPERIVIGTSRPRDERELRQLYANFRVPILSLSPTGAELVKYASNAFLATKVTLANEFARIAERVGVDIDPVLEAVGRDSRIGTKFMRAGPGFGGSCFEKDLRAVTHQARGMGLRLSTLEAVVRSNDEQSDHAYSLVKDSLGGARGRTIAMLGLSFKSGTDDVRGSRALPIVRAAVADGASVRVHDPVALAKFRNEWVMPVGSSVGSIRFCHSPEEALQDADAAILHTPWPEYQSFPPEWTGLMRSPLVVDLRRGLGHAVRRRRDLVWVGLGATGAKPSVGRPLAARRSAP